MANRVRFRATGLAALVGKITIKHSSGESSSNGKTRTVYNATEKTTVSSNTTQHSKRRKG